MRSIVTRTSRPHHAFGQLPFIATASLLIAGFVFLQIARSGEPLALDQGLFACFGNWPERLPYRDVFDSKPPLFLYTWVLAWSFGSSAASVWWFEAVWLAAASGLTFALVARRWDRWTGLTAAALLFFGLWSPGFGGYWSRVQAEELVALPVIAAGFVALAAIERPRLALWAGVLTGVIGLYKIPAMAVAGAWPLLWLATCGHRRAVGRIAWMAAGILAPWLIASVWFAAHGAFGDFFEAVFVYQRHIAAVISPPWGGVIVDFPRELVSELPALLGAAAVGLAVLWRDDRRCAVWLTSWVVLTMIAVILQRQLAGYHYLLVVPALALAAAVGVTALARATRAGRVATRVAAAVALLALALLTLRSVGQWREAYGPGVSYRFGDLSRDVYLRGFTRGLISPRVEEAAATQLRVLTSPDESILVWGLAPGIYALADRRPVTRYPFHKLLMTDAPLSRRIPGLDARRADFMRRLHADPPAYILVGTDDANPFEPDDSVTGMMRFPELAAFVERYEQEAKVGRFVVLRRSR